MPAQIVKPLYPLAIVMPVARMDFHLAVKQLRWIRLLDPNLGHPDNVARLFVLCAKELSSHELWRLRDAAAGVGEIVIADVEERGYFGGTPNAMFRAGLELVEALPTPHPMLYLEADCVPMHTGWEGVIRSEYVHCEKPCLGDHVIEGQTIPHQTGVAIYPWDWRALFPSFSALPGPKLDQGWDSACAHETLPQSHKSTTIRQVWRPEKFTKDNWRKIVPEGTALFHQCKDGSLIDVLCEEMGLPPIPMDEPLCQSTYEIQRPRPIGNADTRQMNVEILMVTFGRDAAFAKYSLEGLKKYAKGFKGITVVVPKKDEALFQFVHGHQGVKLILDDEPEGKGFMNHARLICQADLICPNADAILHVDADVMPWRPFEPKDLMVDGKPKILREHYAICGTRNPNRLLWRPTVQAACGILPEFDPMVAHPFLHIREVYGRTRAKVEAHTGKKFDEYVMGCRGSWPMEFAEFPLLGTIAQKFFPERYSVQDYDHGRDMRECAIGHDQFQYIYRRDRDFFCELWSHGTIARYEADLRNFLAGQLPKYYVK